MNIAKMIKKECKADYVLAVKENQKTLYDDISDYFRIDEIRENLTACENYRSTSEKAHGQFETRNFYITDDIAWLSNKSKWEGIKSIGMVETVITKGEKTTIERRYYISSLAAHIDLFMKAVRGHWAIESMHWHLDVTFKEDANTTIDKNAATNQNIIRKWALAILKRVEHIHGKNIQVKAKRYAMSLDPFGSLAQALSI
ncbi:ISAs1 family transposase [Treponema phagedenis]|uniref:ISAs1 family transposase n=1 Tax=Treponema phagedenis TaxID=162 RepID=UPI001C0660FD|nr:ISAs1 family transposase [Treponema phagedenis]